jgi:lysophospholipase L1-like esterase
MIGTTIGDDKGLGVSVGYGSSSSGPSLPSDSVSLSAAFSLIKRNPDYTGPCVKVRKTGDAAGTGQDFGFTPSGFVNLAAIEAYIGAFSGAVEVIYNQSGPKNLEMTTDSLQPILYTRGGGYIRFTSGKYVTNGTFLSLSGNSSVSLLWRAPVGHPDTLNTQQAGVEFNDALICPYWTVTQSLSYRKASTFYYSDIANEDDGWRNDTLIFQSGLYTSYADGAQSSVTTTVGAPNYSSINLGKNAFGDGNFDFVDLCIYSSAIDAEANYIELRSKYSPMYEHDPLHIFLGDSISTTLYAGLGESVTYKAYSTDLQLNWYAYARGGNRIIDVNTNTLDAIIRLHPASEIIVTIFMGTNDIAVDGVSGEVVFSRLMTLITTLKTLGAIKIIVVTTLPREDSSSPSGIAFETKRIDYNNRIKADVSGDIDHVVDVEAISGIGEAGDQDGSNYVAYVHLGASGTDLLAAAIAEKLALL